MIDLPFLAPKLHELGGGISARPLPLVVDLDGGLLKRDPGNALISAARRAYPWRVMKDARLAKRRPDICAANLAVAFPDLQVRHDVNADVVDLMRVYARFTSEIVVISRAPAVMAERMVAHLGLHARVYGSDDVHRLDRLRKARVVEAVFGPHGFVFVGPVRHREDLCLAARRVIGVGGGEATRAELLTFGVSASFLPTPDWIPFDLRAGALVEGNRSNIDPLNRRVSRDIWERDRIPETEPSCEASATKPERRRA